MVTAEPSFMRMAYENETAARVSGRGEDPCGCKRERYARCFGPGRKRVLARIAIQQHITQHDGMRASAKADARAKRETEGDL